MPAMDPKAAAMLQQQQAKIERAGSEFLRLLRGAVAEQRHGEITVSVPVRGGVLDIARFDPAYSVKL